MVLEKIISLANQKTKIQFLVMERSLRASGCQLPIWVIPYDDNLFELPLGSTWWNMPEITSWLDHEEANPLMKKYQSLTTSNYQYVDSDVCFIRNPEEALLVTNGFITSCGHWHNYREAMSTDSIHILATKSTVWQQAVFNAGQFACSQTLYTPENLMAQAMDSAFIESCIRLKWSDQPGLNMLVSNSNISVSNLTLPPFRMESTWAGDYPGDYKQYWTRLEQTPYIIHWAGNQMLVPRPINDIFYQYLTTQERIEWDIEARKKSILLAKENNSLSTKLRRIRKLIKSF